MANVLDSFVLEFALDPSKFTAGQKQIMQQMAQLQAAALAQAKDVESSSKRVLDVISNMRREVLTAFGVFFGGRELGEFVKYITNLDAATGRLAITMGMSASDTSAWQGAIKQAGFIWLKRGNDAFSVNRAIRHAPGSKPPRRLPIRSE